MKSLFSDAAATEYTGADFKSCAENVCYTAPCPWPKYKGAPIEQNDEERWRNDFAA